MRIILISIISLISFSVFSRQYIQCAFEDSWNRMVVNLDGDQSTLFLTNGLHLPDARNMLRPLKFENQYSDQTTFRTEGEIYHRLIINNEDLNVAKSYFTLDILFFDTVKDISEKFTVGCFSSVYN